MKSLLILCSFLLLGNSSVPELSNAINAEPPSSINNPYLELAKIKNSNGTCIDEYVNTILRHTDITADMILNKAKDSDSWLYKEFIMDEVYMGRVNEKHAALRRKYSDDELQSEVNFDLLKQEFPHFARVLPIFSNLDNRM